MLPDDRKDFLMTVKQLDSFLDQLGKTWVRERKGLMPHTSIRLSTYLDEIAGLMVCEEPGCRELAHGDWDFCLTHGRGHE